MSTCTACDGFGWTESFDRCPNGCESSITEVRRGQRNGMVVAREAVARTGEQYAKVKPSAAPRDLATVKQVAYLNSLIEGADQANATVVRAKAASNYGMTKRAASEYIDALRNLPRVATASATVRSNRYAGRCVTCGTTVAEGAGRIAPRSSGKGWDTFHLDGQCPSVAAQAPVVPADGLDLSPLAKYTSADVVRFAVPQGETRLKLRLAFKNGTVWVSDAAVYGERTTYGSQRPGQAYRGKCVDALRAILADPMGALAAYGHLTSTCGVCGRPLEDADSVARGIGPICAGRL